MEAAALKTARGASSGIDSLTVSIAKGAAAANVLSNAFERVVGWLKEQIVETSRLAARNETLAVVNAQLARANGYSEGSIERLVGRVRELGITTQASRDIVNKMIASQLDLSKATELARLAQDAAVVAGQDSSQALQGIIAGIATQQIEVLRTYGINIQFERAFTEARRRLGRDLTEIERRNTALNVVLAEGPKIAGAYEASLGTVGKQIGSLNRYIEEAILTEQETIAVLAGLKDPFRLIVASLISTGTRISELLALQWKHVDLDNGSITICQRNWHGDIDAPKTQAGHRTLALGSLVDEYRARRGAAHPDAWVFPQPDCPRRPMWDSTVRYAIHTSAKAAGCDFPGLGPHSFRRINITWRQEAGASAIEAAQIAGHSTVRQTYDYTRTQLKRQEETTRAIQERLGSSRGSVPAGIAPSPEARWPGGAADVEMSPVVHHHEVST